jgi:hypothetical protein
MSMNIYRRYLLLPLTHLTFPAAIVSFVTVDCALLVFWSLKLGGAESLEVSCVYTVPYLSRTDERSLGSRNSSQQTT